MLKSATIHIMNEIITVETNINAPIDKIWQYWNEPEHITKWCFASDDWHAPSATNDLTVGGKLNTRMESKDGAHGFDFEATYTEIIPFEKIQYEMSDGRKVEVVFKKEDMGYRIIETFDAENENPIEVQRDGWQAILNNFKRYVETN